MPRRVSESAVPLDASHVGRRVVVRSRLPGERGPSGGPAMTDVIGVLRTYDQEQLVVRQHDGTDVTIALDLVVSAKPVPPGRGPRIDPEELQAVCAQGWVAPDREPLGEWLLRSAGGFTGRANSALVHRDPGLPFEGAAERVVDFYRSRGRTPLAQVVVGTDWDETFTAAGWHNVSDRSPVVQVGLVRSATLVTRDRPEVELIDAVDDSWLRLYNRAADVDPDVVRTVLESGPRRVFARIGAEPLAIGRMVVVGKWSGISAVEVTPDHRRRGLATAVVDTLMRWADSEGARWCYLQTFDDNAAAHALYAKYGFTTHHSYRYLRAPE